MNKYCTPFSVSRNFQIESNPSRIEYSPEIYETRRFAVNLLPLQQDGKTFIGGAYIFNSVYISFLQLHHLALPDEFFEVFFAYSKRFEYLELDQTLFQIICLNILIWWTFELHGFSRVQIFSSFFLRPVNRWNI